MFIELLNQIFSISYESFATTMFTTGMCIKWRKTGTC